MPEPREDVLREALLREADAIWAIAERLGGEVESELKGINQRLYRLADVASQDTPAEGERRRWTIYVCEDCGLIVDSGIRHGDSKVKPVEVEEVR